MEEALELASFAFAALVVLGEVDDLLDGAPALGLSSRRSGSCARPRRGSRRPRSAPATTCLDGRLASPERVEDARKSAQASTAAAGSPRCGDARAKAADTAMPWSEENCRMRSIDALPIPRGGQLMMRSSASSSSGFTSSFRYATMSRTSLRSKKRHAADQHVGHLRRAQLGLEDARLGAGAEQDREVAPLRLARFDAAADLADHGGGLVASRRRRGSGARGALAERGSAASCRGGSGCCGSRGWPRRGSPRSSGSWSRA